MKILLFIAGIAFFLPTAVLASDFEKTIQPLLKDRCVKCHGPTKAKAGLDLSSATGLARGGKGARSWRRFASVAQGICQVCR